jgi:hypothetical protein
VTLLSRSHTGLTPLFRFVQFVCPMPPWYIRNCSFVSMISVEKVTLFCTLPSGDTRKGPGKAGNKTIKGGYSAKSVKYIAKLLIKKSSE